MHVWWTGSRHIKTYSQNFMIKINGWCLIFIQLLKQFRHRRCLACRKPKRIYYVTQFLSGSHYTAEGPGTWTCILRCWTESSCNSNIYIVHHKIDNPWSKGNLKKDLSKQTILSGLKY